MLSAGPFKNVYVANSVNPGQTARSSPDQGPRCFFCLLKLVCDVADNFADDTFISIGSKQAKG